METFPAHQFRAQWQHKQMKNLLDNLPFEHACCIHDYSENYACQQQDQIQSMYYGQIQASIPVTVLHRHILIDVDGEESREEDPRIITEYLFTISEDLRHDHHSVHACRVNVANYLKGIGYKVDTMHEWTDRCSAQYKSRDCMGDVTYSKLDFGFSTIQNYFETSHAKGPQDGAGANLKHKADMAVIRREIVIQNAKKNLCKPTSQRFQSQVVKLKRRVFCYESEHDSEQPYRMFKEVQNNRRIHSIVANDSEKKLKTRNLSCYCENCLESKYNDCRNWTEIELETERVERRVTCANAIEQRERIVDLIPSGSTVAIASGDVAKDYYLFEVLSDGAEILRKSTKDDWGGSFRANTEVLTGHFYTKDSSRQHAHVYQLVSDKKAIVYAATARFICSDLLRIYEGRK